MKANRNALKEALEQELKVQKTVLNNDEHYLDDYNTALSCLTDNQFMSKKLIETAKADIETDRMIRATVVHAINEVIFRLGANDGDTVTFDELRDMFK